VVSIVAVIIGVRMHSKSSGWQEQIKRLTDENTQLKTKHPAPKSNQLKTNTATAETQVDDLKIENEQIEPLKQELNKAKEDVNKLTEENKQLKTENAQIANLEQTINNANLQAQQLKEENETLQKKNEQIEPLNTENDSIKRDNAILLNTIQKMEDDKQSLIQDYEKAMEKPTLSKSADASFFDFTAEPVLSQSQPVEGIQLKAEKVDVETETDAGITNEFPMVVNEQVFTNAMQTIQQELTKYEGEITNRQSLLEHRVLVLQNTLRELTPQ
jgi:DNA repair exonuclease SbcCD ATPase subunit